MGKKVIDAEFKVVSGPYRVGDENREKRGWFWSGRYDRKGRALWWRPPVLSHRLIERIAAWTFGGIIVLAFIGMALERL